MEPTNEEIQQRGLEALRKELGRAGMIRFLQQFDKGHGDYAKERHAWVDRTTLDEIVAAARRERQATKRKQHSSQRAARRKSSA